MFKVFVIVFGVMLVLVQGKNQKLKTYEIASSSWFEFWICFSLYKIQEIHIDWILEYRGYSKNVLIF